MKYKDKEFTSDEFIDLSIRLASGMIDYCQSDFAPEFALGRAQQILEFYISDEHNTKPNRRYRAQMAQWYAKKYPEWENHWLKEVPWNEPEIKYESLPPGHPDHSCMYLKEVCDSCQRKGIQPT